MKSGFVGIVGLPNAGKSSLLNALVKEKLAIVTAKPQTTRKRILGICESDKGQIVFVDAPGWVEAEKGLNHFLSLEFQNVVEDSDALLLLIALDEKDKSQIEVLLKKLKGHSKPILVLLTKSDLAEFHSRKKVILEMLAENEIKAKVLESSTKWGKDFQAICEEVKAWALENLPESESGMYEKGLFTPHSLRELSEEIIREKCFLHLHQELPYSLAVMIRKYDEDEPGLTKIYADILVSKENYKPMVVGKAGAVIKKIGMDARKEIENLVGEKVFLKLEVVVKADWFERPTTLKELGYYVRD